MILKKGPGGVGPGCQVHLHSFHWAMRRRKWSALEVSGIACLARLGSCGCDNLIKYVMY